MPVENYVFGAVVIDGKIYVAGGVGNNFAIIDKTEVYGPQTDKWEKKTGMNVVERCGYTLEVVNGKIYAIGGQKCCPSWVYTIEEYDPIKDEWKNQKNIPVSRYTTASAVENNIIYIIGGWDSVVLADVYSYDPASKVWEEKSDLPIGGRYDGSACSINGKIYFMVGSSSGNSSVPTTDVLEYDPGLDEWTKKTDMLIPRVGHHIVVFDKKIYVVGGLKPNIALSDLIRDVKAGSSKSINEKNWIIGKFSW